MNKCISIGVNNIPKYLYFLPLVKWAWAKFGWDTHIYFAGEHNKISEFVARHVIFNNHIDILNGWNSETVAQVCRMYACYHVSSYTILMTSDSDILPLSDYWRPHDFEVTCYGRDLSDEHQPICYVAMSAAKWFEVMDCGSEDYRIEMFTRMYDNKDAPNIWTLDQHILTAMLDQIKNKRMINRGTDPKTNYPVGRIDRSSWSLDHRQFIDCHMPHDILTNELSFHKVMQMLHTVFPDQDFNWFVTYHKEFKKLL